MLWRSASQSSSSPSSASSSSSEETPFLLLAEELLFRTASFLAPEEVLNLSKTCKTLHGTFSCLQPLYPPRQLFATEHVVLPQQQQQQQQQQDTTRRGGDASTIRQNREPKAFRFMRIPIPSKRVHSMTLSFSWCEQIQRSPLGRGGATRHHGAKHQRSCKILIVATENHHPSTAAARNHRETIKNRTAIITTSETRRHCATAATIQEDNDAFNAGRIVCMTTEEPRSRCQVCELSFVPVLDESYHVWCILEGACEGVQVTLQDGKVRAVVFDDADGNWARNWTRLHDSGALGPRVPLYHHQMLLRLCALVQQRIASAQEECGGYGHSSHLCHFFIQYGIPVNEASMMAVHDLVSTEMEHCQWLS